MLMEVALIFATDYVLSNMVAQADRKPIHHSRHNAHPRLTHTRPAHTHAPTHTCAHMHTRAHMHTCSHTHMRTHMHLPQGTTTQHFPSGKMRLANSS